MRIETAVDDIITNAVQYPVTLLRLFFAPHHIYPEKYINRNCPATIFLVLSLGIVYIVFRSYDIGYWLKDLPEWVTREYLLAFGLAMYGILIHANYKIIQILTHFDRNKE